MKFWDLKSHNKPPIDTIKNFRDSISKIVINGPEVIAASIDGNVRTFDIRMGEIIVDDIYHPIQNFALSNDKKSYCVSCLDNKVRLVDKE